MLKDKRVRSRSPLDGMHGKQSLTRSRDRKYRKRSHSTDRPLSRDPLDVFMEDLENNLAVNSQAPGSTQIVGKTTMITATVCKSEWERRSTCQGRTVGE